MKLIRFSVNHPVTTCMLMLALFMGGIYSSTRMAVELLPGISIPTIVVLTEVPKTSPERVHEEVTLPMEEVLNSVGNVVSLNAVSLEGKSQLVLEFEWGSDVRMAEIEIREQVGALNLPESADKPIIKRYDPSSAPVFRFDILGENLSTQELRRIADKQIKPGLERLAGVAEVEIIGGTDPEIRVIGSLDRLAQYNLTVLSLVQCISRESKNRKGGNIAIEGGKVASLRIIGKADTTTDLENLIVATSPTGTSIRVKDVAQVIRTNKESISLARVDGAPSVGMAIKKSSDESVVAVIDEIQKELTRLTPSINHQGADIRISQNDSDYVVSAQKLVFTSIIQGIALAGILLFLFLRDIRATVIVILATPISLMAATIVLNGLGISRNVLTLGGMGLAAGMTLDSSIVLIESIYRQLSLGHSSRESAIRGASEVATGIFSSTMTTVVVFLPILFIPGLMHEIFQSLAHAVIWTVLASMVVGILFIPMISARILTPPNPAAANSSNPIVLAWFWICQKLARLDHFTESSLAGTIRYLLGSLPRKLGIVVVLITASIFALKFLPGRGFLPPGNVDELWVRFEAPAGSTLDYVDERITQVEQALQQAPFKQFVDSVSTDVRSRAGKLYLRLVPKEERPVAWASLSKCVKQIRIACEAIPDLSGNSYVSLVDKIRGGTRAPIIFKIHSKKPANATSEVQQLVSLQTDVKNQLLPAAESIPSALYQRVRLNETPKEIQISTQFDREAIVERGLTTQLISDTVRASVYGVSAATVIEQTEEIDVTVLLEDSNGEAKGNFNRDALETLMVRSPSTGSLHEIREVAKVSELPAAGSIVLERNNRKPSVNLESHFAAYDITGETISDVTDQIETALARTPEFSESFGYQIQSEAKDTIESFADATLAFFISVILIYMIMCSQFENFSDPLAIMITVPLAALGSVALLIGTGEITSLGAFVGSVILCGVVVNNGIIMIEYVNILRRRGVERDDAIIQGSVRKLRSILITSLTSILGMAPLVFGIGEGTELYRGVAAVIVGGLLVSTPLTLLALPLLYSLLDELSEFAESAGLRIGMAKDQLIGGKL